MRLFDSRPVEISELIGATVVDLSFDENPITRIQFDTDKGSFLMYHEQDCCETVELEEVIGGELRKLIGQTILDAYSSTNDTERPDRDYIESFLWTFYTIRTNLQTLTLRWLGESNGYYSEAVDFVKLN